jgi:hypothetical protein
MRKPANVHAQYACTPHVRWSAAPNTTSPQSWHHKCKTVTTIMKSNASVNDVLVHTEWAIITIIMIFVMIRVHLFMSDHACRNDIHYHGSIPTWAYDMIVITHGIGSCTWFSCLAGLEVMDEKVAMMSGLSNEDKVPEWAAGPGRVTDQSTASRLSVSRLLSLTCCLWLASVFTLSFCT